MFERESSSSTHLNCNRNASCVKMHTAIAKTSGISCFDLYTKHKFQFLELSECCIRRNKVKYLVFEGP